MKIEAVTWWDSRGASSSWQFSEDIMDEKICLVHSVGVIVHENNERIVVSPHNALEPDGKIEQTCGIMTIPKVCIEVRKVIHELQ